VRGQVLIGQVLIGPVLRRQIRLHAGRLGTGPRLPPARGLRSLGCRAVAGIV